MSIIELIKSEYLSMLFGALAGTISTWFTHRIIHKRGKLTYFVRHERVGVTAKDNTFGSVEVRWNENLLTNLYLSTLVIKNESLNDYENVTINIMAVNTSLLTEQSQIVSTPFDLSWSERYEQELHIDSEEGSKDEQVQIFKKRREYIVPVLNRYQEIKVAYLNDANVNETPEIHLTTLTKGLRVKFKLPQNQILGVPQPQAGLAGTLIGVIGIFPLIIFSPNSWIIGIGALIYGLFAQFPGAYAIKLYRFLREFIGG